ncbi:integrator complex subunit 4-like [Babylonia areolata]|uniref:integrator complex subunit 4-like n=1 Tax=Babylonia areolata TaxID=304850 RepID=UPI003FD283B9
MAAKLKKRALAEFSHVIQEEPRPIKRLRLVQKPAQPEVHLKLQSTNNTSQEILQALVTLEQSFPIEQAVAERIFPELMEQYNGSRDALVRSKILNVFTRLASVPGFNPQVISDQLLPMLQTEESHKVTSNILSVLITIGCCLPNSLSFHHQLVTAARQLLSSPSHFVRARCLELIGELWTSDEKVKDTSSTDSALCLLGQYTADDDPRVRTAAFTAMLRLYERGRSLSQSVYGQACSGLGDDNEDVRRKATKLVWVLCRLYPESMVSSGGGEVGEDLRLVDDGFAKICNMMNDLSVNVRVESAALLGSMHQVSGGFLEQTLDKKLMSNMRRKVSAHERAKEHFESGEWATGARWADDKPRENMDADSVSLMNIGACGAFVHGLEDEFLEVRNAALDSLCELAVQSPRFAVLSQDSIIDMVNDEIESVRLNAIHSLHKLSGHLTLRDDQLDIVLGVLQDFSFSTREALRGLLGEIRMATRESVNSTLMALLENMMRYPEDRTSIYSCSRQIGQHHSQLTMMLAEELLCLHPYFDSPEPNTEDPCYITVLLAVFNAASLCPTMVALFPEHTRRHYTYLRCSLPHLLPPIQALEDAESQVGEKVVAMAATSTGDFFQQLLAKLAGLSSLDLDSAEQLLRICVRDLERVEALDSQTSAPAECLSLYLSSQLILTELIKGTMKSDTDTVYQENVTASAEKILQLTTQLHTLFLGLGGELAALVRQTEVKTLAVQLLCRLERSSLGEKVRASNTFRQYLTLIKSSVESDPATYDSFTRQVVSLGDTLDWSQLQVLPGVFRNLSRLLRPTVLSMPSDVRRTRAVIEEPPPSSDCAIKFPAGLATTVTMVATLHNMEDTNRVSVLVRYPDQHAQYVTPALSSWTRLGPLTHRLVTPVMLSHALWSESCYVELSLVVEACGEGRQLLKLQENVPLTKPVKVLVSPKPLKR